MSTLEGRQAMSCDDCDTAPLHGAYIRFGDSEIGFGNIEIVACKKHWVAARDKLCAPRFSPEEREALKSLLSWLPTKARPETIKILKPMKATIRKMLEEK